MDIIEPEPWRVALQEMQQCRLAPWQSPTELQDEVVWAYGRLEETYRQWRKERAMKKYSLIVLDVDGTLVRTKSGETFRQGAEDWQWLPGRLERCEELRKQGVTLALATNQGGVAFGYMEEPDITVEIQKVAFAIDASIWHICYDHPKATIERYRHDSKDRKPGPGMLLNIMETLKLLPQDTLMVGDREEDQLAAEAAGVDFAWSWEFFKD